MKIFCILSVLATYLLMCTLSYGVVLLDDISDHPFVIRLGQRFRGNTRTGVSGRSRMAGDTESLTDTKFVTIPDAIFGNKTADRNSKFRRDPGKGVPPFDIIAFGFRR